MKPHEETWEADDDRVWCPATRATVAFGPMDEGSAKLAAQAPAMARLLLEREWESHELGDYCLSCNADRPTWLSPDKQHTAHKPDCAWLTTLIAAGVIDAR